ncbi:putative aspartic protease [Morus notabilis]|uniref:Putative aspartic protease n=1 Tax=Morus notabilis TaxID=981085 RepID=W9RFQ4_9ROSA|nr:putative aspartic protease [Morus notabilis]
MKDGALISLELIHRTESPKSPLYSPSQSPWERLANALRRSNIRIKTLRAYQNYNINAPQSDLVSSKGEYLMTIFGCGHQNGGISGGIESGIAGLGSGKLSLVSQMGSSINGKFSYCLSSPSKLSSKINFGGKGMFSSPGVVSTPFLSKASLPYYYLILEGISVGSKRFNVHNSTNMSPLSSNFWWSFKGNIVIDSRATLSYLPRQPIGNSNEGGNW